MTHKLILQDTNDNIILTKIFKTRKALDNYIMDFDLFDEMIYTNCFDTNTTTFYTKHIVKVRTHK